jgi:ABC-type transport system involved in multi-copper enzyme maturation permease subunit
VSVTLAVSAALVGLAIGRMRAVVVGQQDRPAGRRPEPGGWRLRLGTALGLEPSLDDSPALWYEWHRKRPSPWIRALIRTYFALAIGFSLMAIEDSLRPTNPFPGWLPGYVIAFQVVMGLPLLLIAAATALVEERVRGSLDVLLATPLSTRSIVLAKWWSVLWHLPRLLALPAAVAAVLAAGQGHWKSAALLIGFVVSAAAAWTSVGLALSTWIPRLGRAVSAAVGLYTLVSLGWPVMALTSYGRRQLGAGLSEVSPFYGSFDLTVAIEHPGYVQHLRAWGLIWTIAHAAVAVLLLLATLATFNRCFGRVGEAAGGGPRPSIPAPPAQRAGASPWGG